MYDHQPDMGWGEACDEIVRCFPGIEIALGAYLSKHGAVLKPEVKGLLGSSIGIAGEYKFESSNSGISSHANLAAAELYKKLDEAEESLLQQVYSQSST